MASLMPVRPSAQMMRMSLTSRFKYRDKRLWFTHSHNNAALLLTNLFSQITININKFGADYIYVIFSF